MNPTMIQFFHWYTEGDGHLYEHLKQNAEYLKSLGISSVWMPPAFKGQGGGYSVGYDPYDLFDLGEFDQKGSIPTKYGTKEAYIQAVRALQAVGIQVVADIVLNHKAGGDELETFHAMKVDDHDRNNIITEPVEISSFTKFNFPGRKDKYSDFKWDFTCFSGVDYAEGREKGIFQIITDHGDGWEETISDEKGNYDYLMYNDIEHRNPFVREELNHWGKWYHDEIGFDGVRLDAVKHISYSFYKEWLQLLRSNTNKNIFAVGEYWAPGKLSLLQKYIEATEGSMSLFDSVLQHNMHVASKEGAEYDMRQLLQNTLVQADPLHAVTVVDNHDTQPLQQLEAPVEEWFKPIAYAFILLRADGLPCLFYPDLYGAHYWDKDRDGNDQEIFLNKVSGIEEMLRARMHHAYGEQKDYMDDAHKIGWVRTGDENHSGCVVTLSNAEGGTIRMEMGTAYAGKTFKDSLGRLQDEIVIGEDGWAEFTVPAGNVSVWLSQE